jgi:hypothetical protein
VTRYAQGTDVSSDKSRSEIERTLARYGADQFFYGWQDGAATIGFRMHDRRVQFILPLPDRSSDEFALTPSRKWARSDVERDRAYEQAVRQKWRALALVVKAKLEAVESGITTFEEEFLAHIVLPSGQRVGAWMIPQVTRAYELGTMPPLLPLLESKERG